MRNEEGGMLGFVRVGGRGVRDFWFFEWERFAGIQETRGFSAETWSDPRGLWQIQK